MRADDEALTPDAEEFALDGIEVVRRADGFLKTVSSDSVSRSRGPTRSIGVSFKPSGIHTFVTQG